MIPLGEFSIDQIGFVVRDIEAFISQLKIFFDISEPRIIDWPIEGIDPHSTLYGEPAKWKNRLGFISLENINIELIQPIEGDSIFKRFLEDHGPGLHHLRSTADDFNEMMDSFIDSGYEKIASGDGVHAGSRWAFFDTTSDFQGLVVELRTKLDEHTENSGWLK